MVIIMTELCLELEWKFTVAIILKTKTELKLLNMPVKIPTITLIFEPPQKLSI